MLACVNGLGLLVTSCLRWCQQWSQDIHDVTQPWPSTWNMRSRKNKWTENGTLYNENCIKLMDQIGNYGFEVESPVILVFVHSCHIDSLSLSLGTRVYCSLALKTCRHSTCQLSLAVLSCELWKAGCLADKNHASQRFYCTEPWTGVHKATDFIPSAHIWEQYLSPV